jgi:DNA-binding transcriptional MerR regulator
MESGAAISSLTSCALPEPSLRMKDLCERTGLPRQAIHFYIQQGLLPQGHKTGRNMAYYGEEHVERLLLIRKLQHERFLPLKAIRALLDEAEDAFSPLQRSFLNDVRSRLGGRLSPEQRSVSTVRVNELLERTLVSRADFDRLVDMGLFGAGADEQGAPVIAVDDAWIVETWAEIQRIGFNAQHGFSVDDFALYEDAINQLFQRETRMLKERLAMLGPDVAAPMIERVIPILNAFIARYHGTLVRNFFTGA